LSKVFWPDFSIQDSLVQQDGGGEQHLQDRAPYGLTKDHITGPD
jgi:hypothetical protein